MRAVRADDSGSFHRPPRPDSGRLGGLPHRRSSICRAGAFWSSARWRKTNGKGIIPAVLPTMPFTLKRLMAAALPVSFLWLFAACILICEREVGDTHGRPVVSSPAETVEVGESPDCGECPVTSLPEATAPERTAFKLDWQSSSGVVPSIPSLTLPAGGIPSFPPDRHPPPADPPLDRLPALRI